MASAAELKSHEDHGEERADVDQQEDFAQAPCQQEGQQNAEGEENVAPYGTTGLLSLSGR
jgi:hypothetical protein